MIGVLSRTEPSPPLTSADFKPRMLTIRPVKLDHAKQNIHQVEDTYDPVLSKTGDPQEAHKSSDQTKT